MNVLLIGSGGREDAISEALINSRRIDNLFATIKNNNPGIVSRCKDFLMTEETDIEKIVDYAIKKEIDIAIIGPEAPLNVGLVDSLEEYNIKTVGPIKKVAKIETDKSWARRLMADYRIDGCPIFEIFDDVYQAKEFLEDNKDVVIKPAGLTGGKGVKVMGEHIKNKNDAIEYIKEVIEKHKSVILEEKLEGEEFTIQTFTDGYNLIGSPAVQDHKRAYEGDIGPNTGGMGSYSDRCLNLPFMNKKDYNDAIKILKDTISAIRDKTGERFKGILYGQFMLCRDGVKLIEYNARFGDPEAMNILPILKIDFLDIAEAIVDKKIDKLDIDFEEKATVCKYIVPKGYPSNPKTDSIITIEGKINKNARLYYSSVNKIDDKIYTTKSRSLAIIGIAETISKAEKIVENEIIKVKGDIFYRRDIGTDILIKKRIEHINRLRRIN
ncbi:MAG: phosphoribosylamine--glycine ligase [Candidatus Methanoliparum thermophilum]|uniref:Phosphoribosylamine--glycine ligase n=1 Tax=Methanoliparum thermophilum TaxID=2491083 RepID=A0A520KSI6_METT2|nr:phosphoribosylamine--glycine ligase [Candidatus Methanoliparum sp. LAM-1]RZN64888.1 MAG: phosphoribosylamine--glycine ligase [Candidatus Methanoliparum thermophilum]BDC36239.1 phosphoribosylamine--glycine ligase [Candidatus Methanoliparum sp. LAM-1]